MKYFEKTINVTQPSLPDFDKYAEKIRGIWDNHWLTNQGELHREFETKLQEYLEVENISLFVNGHTGLELTLKAMELNGEIITTAFTFVSTTHAIVNAGCKPIFCDINLEDLSIDPLKIESLITKDSVAILPVHIFGLPCNIKEIEKIALKHNLKVIYDAAQVFGVKIDGKSIGSFGDASAFSLNATKVMHSIEGGAVVFKDKTLKKNLNIIKNFGLSGHEEVEIIGTNGKMNEFSAAMGLVNLQEVDVYIENRKLASEVYRRILQEIPGITLFKERDGVQGNYSYFPILIDESITKVSRDVIHDKLNECNIFTRKYFYPLVTDFKCYRDTYGGLELPVSRYVAKRILTLPLYSNLSEEEAIDIALNIKEIIEFSK